MSSAKWWAMPKIPFGMLFDDEMTFDALTERCAGLEARANVQAA